MGDMTVESLQEIEERRANIWEGLKDNFCASCNMVSTLLETEIIVD
jgi:hypothetical protein